MKMKRRRRTRKSLMREKLEKTLKEKGFLIQTQQLESAEGATYCKFRQLRKFTRYLFRSWKDYLPDHVKEISDNNAAGMQQVAMEQRPDSGKIGEGLSPSRKDSRNSSSKDGHGSLDQSMDLRSLGFRDEDGDEDDGDADDDDEFDEDEPEGMISEDDNDNNNHVERGTLSSLEPRGKAAVGRSYLLKESEATSPKDDNDSDRDDEDEEEVNVTDSSLAPRLPPSTTITLTKSVDDEEELQVDG